MRPVKVNTKIFFLGRCDIFVYHLRFWYIIFPRQACFIGGGGGRHRRVLLHFSECSIVLFAFPSLFQMVVFSSKFYGIFHFACIHCTVSTPTVLVQYTCLQFGHYIRTENILPEQVSNIWQWYLRGMEFCSDVSMKWLPLHKASKTPSSLLSYHHINAITSEIKGKSNVFPVHAMKVYRGSRDINPLALNLGWRWVVNFIP
jgi:hypothetical protein